MAGPVIARRPPRSSVDPVEKAVSDAVAEVAEVASNVVANASRRWVDGGGAEAVQATVSLGILAAHVAVAHARAAAAAFGLRRRTTPPTPPSTTPPAAGSGGPR